MNGAPSTATAMAVAPDSPAAESSQSPPPPGLQGDLEMELMGLANALYNLGTTVVNDSTKEKPSIKGAPDMSSGKPVGQRVNDVIGHLSAIDDMAAGMANAMIPMQVIQDLDNARNPMLLTKERIERAATENQFMNGKIKAIQSYRSLLNATLKEHFPELENVLED